MKVATWNLESNEPLTPERKVAFRKAMAEVDADVWVLTETWKDFAPVVDGYKLVSESCAAVDLESWPDRRWVAIWVKSKFDAETVEVHSQPDRMACARMNQSGKLSVVVIGTVLPWGNFDKLWRGDDGFCAAFAIQEAEWEGLRGSPKTSSLAVLGDFNLAIPYKRYYGPERGGIALKTAFDKHDLVCLTEGNDPLTEKPRIDHICVSRSGLRPSFLPQAGEWAIPCIGEKEITDHSGVFANLEVS
jgi:hypothetical protein